MDQEISTLAVEPVVIPPLAALPPVNADELYNSGFDHIYGNNKVKINPEEGARRIIESANTGRHVLAAGHHALLLFHGRIIPQDIQAFKNLCAKPLVKDGLVWSANNGIAEAQTLIARLGETGFDLSNVEVFKQTRKAQWWPFGIKAATISKLFCLAAKQEYGPAEECVAKQLLEPQNGDKMDAALGLNYLRRAAERGLASAEYALYNIYENGHFGVERDIIEARKWLGRAARQGHRPANTALLATLEIIKDNAPRDALKACK